jgi:membrane protease subunit HflC
VNAALSWKNPIVLAVAAIALLVVLASTLAVVPETRQAVIVQFGKPKFVVNRYQPGDKFGSSGAGVILRVPFLDQIVWLDKRVMDIEMERQQVLSTDQRRLNVDAYARFRIVDPLRTYLTAGNEERVADQLRPVLGSALRNELGKIEFARLLSPERGAIMDAIQAGLNRVSRQYGAEIVDVRIKRADLPEGTPLESALDQMRSARDQEALTIDAQGRKEAQIVRAQADADAARTYAGSFGKDPQFYDFYRAMQSYRQTFGANGQQAEAGTTMVLSPNNSYLREFTGNGR